MLKTYEETLNWIHSRLRFGIKPGLERMTYMMEKLGNPHLNVPVIHVAGTNGKGSTVSYMRSVLNEAGYQVGTFTSPYIESFNERISMNGVPFSTGDLIHLANGVKRVAERAEAELGEHPTEFEIITAMAFLYFGSVQPPDYLLLETGLGGRLDSTNIAKPVLSVITNAGYDHMNILGSSIEEIAAEKAGIIKADTPVVTGVKAGKGLDQIRSKAEEMNAELLVLGEDFRIGGIRSVAEGEEFNFSAPFKEWNGLSISMYGAHQIENAALALMAVALLDHKGKACVTEPSIRRGLFKARWSGRYERMRSNPAIILDGAHNFEGAESLAETIARHEKGKKVHMLFTALEDKEYEKMLQVLEKAVDTLYVTEFDFPRAASSERLLEAGSLKNEAAVKDWRTFLAEFPNRMNPDEVLVICGSLYFISQVRQFLSENKKIDFR
ncbi:bifunctional folylpolyglutamate synthase/dihydrofolate synthase [Metabacillus sp. 84]|uniref:bifunctional folylpolyglutamate synthase/dihydrofolate synthase n=1 Tax=unclassified Metabacillus TaxID=2675274 RepID=UPI003CEFBCE4